jgi:hypothetical protein
VAGWLLASLQSAESLKTVQAPFVEVNRRVVHSSSAGPVVAVGAAEVAKGEPVAVGGVPCLDSQWRPWAERGVARINPRLASH